MDNKVYLFRWCLKSQYSLTEECAKSLRKVLKGLIINDLS
jgi:hypothetical protein